MERRFFDFLGVTGVFVAITLTLPGCNSELLEKQAEQIKQQQAEIAAQRKEIEALKAGQKIQDQKQQNCNRAFRDYFEKGQVLADPEKAIALYRQGLALCPDDDVAHYELGKILAANGRSTEARAEFEAALKINPDFTEAKGELDALGDNR
jgi:tetratricopeptide (TPR) repeat protein